MEITKQTWNRKQDYVIGDKAIRSLNAIADAAERYYQEIYNEGLRRGVNGGVAIPTTHPARVALDDALEDARWIEGHYKLHAETVGQNRVLARAGLRLNDLAHYLH